jgi:uncharacterized protein YjiS (DUF1127 family)
MTTIDFNTGTEIRHRTRFTLPVPLRRLLVRLRRHRRRVRSHISLARLDERLLYDIGLEPLALHEVQRHRLPPSMLLDAMRRQHDHRNGMDGQ